MPHYFGILYLLVGTLGLTFLTVLFLKWMKVDIKNIKERTRPKMLMTAIISNLLFILFVYLLVHFYNHKPFTQLHFNFTTQDKIFSLLGIVLTFLVSVLFVRFLDSTNKLKVFKEKHYFENYSVSSTFWALITLFLAALQEEMTFRGYFSLTLQGLSFVSILLISSIVFTVWHFITSRVTLFQVMDWFMGGVSLFLAYSLSGSIWVATLLHFSRNTSNALILNIAGSHSIFTFDKPIAAKYKSVCTLIMSGVWIGLTFLFYKM